MEGIYESIVKIVSKHPNNIITKIKNLTINGEKVYSIELLQWNNSDPDEVVIMYYDGNTEPIDGFSDVILNRILNKVKQSDLTLATNSKPKINPKIDFILNENGKCTQYCFNDFNEQEYLLENNDMWDEEMLQRVLQKLVKNKIIKPKKCKGIIRDNEEGTLFLRIRYYSKNSNLLEKFVHKRTLYFSEWNSLSI